METQAVKGDGMIFVVVWEWDKDEGVADEERGREWTTDLLKKPAGFPRWNTHPSDFLVLWDETS